MSMVDKRQHRQQWAAITLLLASVALVYLCYRPGLGADFHFDDQPNLSGLSKVSDTGSALDYVLSGIAGPLGRPVALASFLLNVGSWPGDPAGFLHVNLLIHLINGLLIAWLALRIGMARGKPLDRAGYTAALVAAIWMLLPILASTNLLVVQRMTSLSALFVLSGLLGYVICRSRLQRSPRLALAGMSGSLVLFTLMALFTKESGVLLPVFALVIESTLLKSPLQPSRAAWRAWQAIFLWLPLAAIIVVLASMAPYTESLAAMRGFTAWERLMTQAAVLWEYLFHAFVPMDTAQLGPFHDTYQPARTIFQPVVLASVFGWFAVIGAAIGLRNKAPVFSFAVLWFLAGHLVESTVVPLELYFEHRNYLPLVGPAFAIAWAAVRVPARWRNLAATGAIAYVGLLALTLWVVAKQWSSPLQEAQRRFEQNPESSRAVGYFAAHLLNLGAVGPADRVLAQAIERDVAPERLRVTRLFLRCQHGVDGQGGRILDELRVGLPEADFDRNLAHALYMLTRARLELDCPVVGIAPMRELLATLERHPLYARHTESLYWIHRARARIAASSGERDKRVTHLKAALDQRFDAEAAGEMIELHLENSNRDQACRLLQRLESEAPLSPVHRIYRYRKLGELEALVQKRTGRNCRSG